MNAFADTSRPERIALCARSMGWTCVPAGATAVTAWSAEHYTHNNGKVIQWAHAYDPYTDAVQSQALKEEHHFDCEWCIGGAWHVIASDVHGHGLGDAMNADLRTAIADCAAAMQHAKEIAK